MIVRPRLHWFRMLLVWRGSVLGRILPQLCFTTLLASGVVFLHAHPMGPLPDLTPIPFTLLGIALAIFLGFRNSVSYERYWEARTIWDAILNDTRSLARQIGSLAQTDAAQRTAFVHALIAYVHAVKHQLRQTQIAPTVLALLPEAEREPVARARFKPALILMGLAEQLRVLHQRKLVETVALTAMDRHLGLLSESLGGCERIASTPIPFAYSVILHRTAYLYCFLLPFGLVATVGAMTPVIVAFVSYTFFALEALAEELQDPFGLEPNDLPLDAMAATIEASLRESIGEAPTPEAPVPVNHLLT